MVYRFGLILLKTSCRGIQWMSCFKMFATDMVSLCYRHCFQSSLPFEPHILQGVEKCQDMTGSWTDLIAVKHKVELRFLQCQASQCDVKLSARTPGPLCRSGASRSDVSLLTVSLQILFSLHGSVLSNNFVANAFSVPGDPFFSLAASHQGISSLLLNLLCLGKLLGLRLTETGGRSSLQGGDALPEKWEAQVSVEIFVLKSPFFGTINKTSRHQYVNIPFTVLSWSLATWLDRLPHVKTAFHGWNMLIRCFRLSSV